MRKLRICFVLPSLHGGGAERAAVKILNALPEETYDRALYLFRREGAYLADVAAGVRVASGEGGGRLRRLNQLRWFLRANQPDVVVSYLSFFSAFLAARGAGRRAKVVVNQQTPVSAFLRDADYLWRRPLRKRMFEAVARSVYPRVDAVVATSRGVGEDLTRNFGVQPDRITILHNPVDLAEIAARSQEPIEDARFARANGAIVVSAGRLAEVKNFPLLVEAMAILSRKMAIQAFILGQGGEKTRLRAAIADAGLEAMVHLLGFQSNPWRYMARADVFALTSRYEGFGNVVVEAMACGAPVVATSSSGTREMIESDVNGVLVDSHDAASVAAALERVLGDRDLRTRLVANGRARVMNFSLPQIVSGYDALFRSLAS